MLVITVSSYLMLTELTLTMMELEHHVMLMIMTAVLVCFLYLLLQVFVKVGDHNELGFS